MNKKEYLLTCLIEECSEIQQAATKALRFGFDSCAPRSDITNSEQIVMEFVDLLAVFEMLLEEKYLTWQGRESSEKALIEKKEKVMRYMAYAGEPLPETGESE